MKAAALPGASAVKSYSLPFRRLVLRRTSRAAMTIAASVLRIAITGPMLARTHAGLPDYSRRSGRPSPDSAPSHVISNSPGVAGRQGGGEGYLLLPANLKQ